MKLSTRKTASVTILLLSTLCEGSKHGSSHQERNHQIHQRLHSSVQERNTTSQHEQRNLHPELKKRGQCAFPTNVGLVAVTPAYENAGWAMSPNQPCTPDSYCPYACPPGQLAMQWNPAATSYIYPLNMDGGLYCDVNGNIQKPFPNRDYCVNGVGNVKVQNNVGKTVAFCQTVLPGNEAMLIPTAVQSSQTLAVPNTDYWCGTAAHYYVNNPGLSTDEACVWSDGSLPLGNWSPYVAGANEDDNGNTFLTVAWNPIYTGSNFANTMPNWGIKIECNGGGCLGLPCYIDPSEHGMNEITSPGAAVGAGGGSFCTATLPKGVTANIVIFNAGDSSGSSSSKPASSSASKASSTSEKPAPTTSSTSSPPPPSTSSSSSSSIEPVPTTSATPLPTPSSTALPIVDASSIPIDDNSGIPIDDDDSGVPIDDDDSGMPTVDDSSTSMTPSSVPSSGPSIASPTFSASPKNATDSQNVSPTGGYSDFDDLDQTVVGSGMLPTKTANAKQAATGSISSTKKPSSASITFRRSGMFGATGLTVVALMVSWFL